MRIARSVGGLAALAGLIAPCAILGGGRALAGPDFATGSRSQPLAASTARSEIEPADDVMFELGSATLSADAEPDLIAAAQWLTVHPEARLVLEGHTDATGGTSYNADLAARRANTVRTRLVAAGVDGDRIVVAVYGENGSHHAAPSREQRDRRVVVYASAAPLSQIVANELAHDAIELSWTHLGGFYRQSRGITPMSGATATAERIRTTGPHGG